MKKSLTKGEYYGRRAVDSKIVKLSEKIAKEIIERPGGRDADDFLVVWWVPSEYVRTPSGSNESKWRIERGFIKPLWDWAQGRLISGRLSFDTVVRIANKKKAVKKKTAAKKPRGRSSAQAPSKKKRISYALPSVLVELGDAIDFELENGVIVSLKNFKLMSTVAGDRLFCIPVESRIMYVTAADTGETKKARALYSRFTAFKSEKKYTLDVQSRPWVFFGAALAISYRSDKWSGRPVDYVHKFEYGNSTECWADDADYKKARLFAFRGQIKITKRGIEG
jgi:hypothetical protein